MEDLINKIRTAMFEEHERMCAKYGDTYHTSHEAYAVTLEEYEEVTELLAWMKVHLEKMWDGIKQDYPPHEMAHHMSKMYQFAIRAAAECVQVAACCHKALQSDCCRDNHDE